MVHSEPIFLPSSCRIFSQEIVRNFAFKAPILEIRDVGEFSPYKVKGGGVIHSPGKIKKKMDANGAF